MQVVVVQTRRVAGGESVTCSAISHYLVAKSYVYTLRLIGPISYPGECDFNGSATKVQRHFLTNASVVTFVTYITRTKIRNRSRLIAVCQRTLSHYPAV